MLPIMLPHILFASAALTMILHFSLNLYKNDSTQAVSTKILTWHRWIGWSALCVLIFFWGTNELENAIVETDPGNLALTHGLAVGMCSIFVIPRIISALKDYGYGEIQKKYWAAAVLICGALFFLNSTLKVYQRYSSHILAVDIFHWLNNPAGQYIHIVLALSLILLGRFALRKRENQTNLH